MRSVLLLLFAAQGGALAKTKTALVLQGGGAKGAFQAGVLQQLCGGDIADSWTLLVGTSIGALNAAYLAQFSPEEQCQKGVPALVAEWKDIKSVADLMVRTGTSEPCGFQASKLSKYVTGIYLLEDLENQNTGGFTCDMAPAVKRYARILDANKIRASGMQFAAPAVSLETGLVRYFNETTEPGLLFQGVVASGTLVPIVGPTLVGQERFMDGGVRANLPILYALHRGAERVIAVLLNPIDLQHPARKFPAPNQPDQFGARIGFLFDVFYDAEFMDDMRQACFHFPHAEIMAHIPFEPIGSMLDFGQASIGQFLEKGRSETRFVQDFCTELDLERGPVQPWITFLLGVGTMVVLVVAFRLASIMSRTFRQSFLRTVKAKVEEDEDPDLELVDIMGRPLE